MSRPVRILFVGEAVTLAHVARINGLASGLDSTCYDVHFAHCPRYRSLLDLSGMVEHDIESVSPQAFKSALAAGKPLYSFATLERYVQDDLALLGEVRPDIVVGDFRISLGVSARLAGVPYITISNAYWSPFVRPRFTVPELPVTRLLGARIGQVLFTLLRPLAFAVHSLPMRRLRRQHGLPSLGFSLERVYTDADYTLYADPPELYGNPQLPENHHFIGPADWSAGGPLPQWWDREKVDGPIVYVSLGSSGHPGALAQVIEALSVLRVTLLVAAAGETLPGALPDNTYLADYLPGEAAVERAACVICNGGSAATYQALARGKPVLGISGNLDQYLNMSFVEKSSAGIGLRAGKLTSSALQTALMSLLENSAFQQAAGALAANIRTMHDQQLFCRLVGEITRRD